LLKATDYLFVKPRSYLFVKPPLEKTGTLRDDATRLFVYLSVCLFFPMQQRFFFNAFLEKNAIFSKLQLFRAVVSISEL